MRYNVSSQGIINMMAKLVSKNRNVYDMRNSTYRILQNSGLSDIKKMIEDKETHLFIVSHKKDVEISASDYNNLVELDGLVREEMLGSVAVMKEILLEVGLTLTPLLGQYKYKGANRITFEMSMMVPLTPAYTGYAQDLAKFYRSAYEIPIWLKDFADLTRAVCELLDQKTILMKSIYFMEKMPIFLMDRNGTTVMCIEDKIEKIDGTKIIESSSLLMEDAKARVPGLDIRDLYGDELRDSMQKSNQWWKMISSKDGSLISMIKTLYSTEDRQFLNSLERKSWERNTSFYVG